ncbi:Inactive rhomboid protein 1 [Bienertia sinuspersici]
MYYQILKDDVLFLHISGIFNLKTPIQAVFYLVPPKEWQNELWDWVQYERSFRSTYSSRRMIRTRA